MGTGQYLRPAGSLHPLQRPLRHRLATPQLSPGITNRYCSPSFETATSRPPQDEVSLVETQQPHAEERATRASRSMGSKRLTYLSWSVLARLLDLANGRKRPHGDAPRGPLGVGH